VSNVYPFGSAQAAELADADVKRESTARARCALLGRALRRIDDDGAVTFAIGLHRFESIAQVEDFLDQIVSDE
jgi:hypothetical protein